MSQAEELRKRQMEHKLKKQDFLEADPYWDQSTVPVNTYKNKSPFLGKVVSVKRNVGHDWPACLDLVACAEPSETLRAQAFGVNLDQ